MMKTKYDIGEIVYLKVIVKEMHIDKNNEIEYRVELKNTAEGYQATDFTYLITKEDGMEKATEISWCKGCKYYPPSYSRKFVTKCALCARSTSDNWTPKGEE